MKATGSRTPPERQIIVGVDGSAAAAAAVRWEARLRRAAVRLVCAYHDDDRLHAPYASWYWVGQAERRAAARALLDRSAGAELLVLGTSKPPDQPDQPPQAIGPVARVCLRRAQCPVVVVAPDDPPGGSEIRGRDGTLAISGGRPSALPRRASVPLG